jgi:hypothetical protein
MSDQTSSPVSTVWQIALAHTLSKLKPEGVVLRGLAGIIMVDAVLMKLDWLLSLRDHLKSTTPRTSPSLRQKQVIDTEDYYRHMFQQSQFEIQQLQRATAGLIKENEQLKAQRHDGSVTAQSTKIPRTSDGREVRRIRALEQDVDESTKEVFEGIDLTQNRKSASDVSSLLH